MPSTAVAPAAYTCHWDYVQGPARNGKSGRTMMWICEYPYPTMRHDGPSSDCAGCPVWEERERARCEAEVEAAEEVRELQLMFRA